MNSPAKDIATLIDQGGFGTFGTDIFVDREPTSPDAVMSVHNTGGFDPMPKIDIWNPTVMVRIRGARNNSLATFAKALNIQRALHNDNEVTVNGSRYLLIIAMGDILSLGRDENDRPLFSINFKLMRTEAA